MRYSNFTLKPAIVITSACGSAWPLFSYQLSVVSGQLKNNSNDSAFEQKAQDNKGEGERVELFLSPSATNIKAWG